MRIDDAKRYIKGIVEKQVPVTVAMMGPSGVGKSAIEKQLAKELGIGFIDLRLANQEPTDLIGIPYRDGDVTRWARPAWFPKEGTTGILCLEELNRAPNDVRQCIFQLIWDRMLHTNPLPAGWAIVLAMNPDNGEYQVETLDKALVRRCSVVTVEPNVNAWLTWATDPKNEVPAEITGFIGTHKDMLFVSENFDFPVVRTPAGWGDTLALLRKAQVIPQDLEFEIIAGVVGKDAAAAFIKYMDKEYERPVNGEEVLNNYKDVREKILKQRKKSDEMYVTIKQIIGISEAAKKLTKKQMENLVSFIDDLNADTAAMLVHEMPSDIISALVEEGQKNGDDRILKVGKASRSAREDK
jgi:hypothetical protein